MLWFSPQPYTICQMFYSDLFCVDKSVCVFYQLLSYSSEATVLFLHLGVQGGSATDSLPFSPGYFVSQLQVSL